MTLHIFRIWAIRMVCNHSRQPQNHTEKKSSEKRKKRVRARECGKKNRTERKHFAIILQQLSQLTHFTSILLFCNLFAWVCFVLQLHGVNEFFNSFSLIHSHSIHKKAWWRLRWWRVEASCVLCRESRAVIKGERKSITMKIDISRGGKRRTRARRRNRDFSMLCANEKTHTTSLPAKQTEMEREVSCEVKK